MSVDAAWRPGVRLGLDIGTVRIGVAICDPDGILATPLMTVHRDSGGASRRGAERAADGRTLLTDDLRRIRDLVVEHGAVEVIIGLPVGLSGREGPAAEATRTYAQQVAAVIEPVPIRFTDERMSTVVGARRLAERGLRSRRQRSVIDQAAAVEILQSWLDRQRRRT